MFLATRIRPLARTIPRTALGAQRPVWATAAARGFQSSALRFNTTGQDTDSTAKTAAVSSSETEKEKETTAGMTEQEPEEPASEGEITARAYDFPWLYNGSSHLTRIPHYPYAKAPKVWALLGWVPQSIQYAVCKSACERMLRNNTSPEYFPDQFLQGAGLAIHKLLPLLSTNVNREPLTSMMTQELYDRFEPELQRQEELKSDVSIKLASVHDGMIKDVWVLLGPKLKSGTSRGFIRWRWQSLTVALRAATDQMSSRDQVAHMMMEGVQFKVDVEFDATIDYTIHSNVLNNDVISDFTRRPLLVRFETPYFEPAEQMVSSRSMSRPHEAPIDWNWRVSDIDYLLEQDFIEKRIKEDIKDEEHAQREMEM
ncbi:hypothetical protein BGZ90_002011 [Linnemannia elongata]|nr:hypothetical protein BGZ90_002011 [Linnemannia elongata]